MTTALDRECDMLVAELAYTFDAQFDIAPSGPNGEMRWFYGTRASNRVPMRSFLQGVDRHRIGFDAAMVRAIQRVNSREAS